MQGKYQKDANYPLTVQPRTEGRWEVLNLESDVSHGIYDSIQAATVELDKQRGILNEQLGKAS